MRGEGWWLLRSAHVFVQVGAADPYVGGFDEDLAFTAGGDGDVVFDLDVFFAVVAGGFHFGGLCVLSFGLVDRY